MLFSSPFLWDVVFISDRLYHFCYALRHIIPSQAYMNNSVGTLHTKVYNVCVLASLSVARSLVRSYSVGIRLCALFACCCFFYFLLLLLLLVHFLLSCFVKHCDTHLHTKIHLRVWCMQCVWWTSLCAYATMSNRATRVVPHSSTHSTRTQK